MSNIIKCNTGTLAADKGDVIQNINQIKQSMSTLSSIAKTLDSVWDGDASEVYKAKFEGYIRELENVCAEMTSIAKFEGKAVTKYDKCEKQISGMIESISI